MSAAAGTWLTEIDWSAPWLQPWREVGERVAAHVGGGATVAEALNDELVMRPVVLAAGALRFVPQRQLPAGVAYEAHIAATARVPTRELRHDFFNGLAWLHHPRLKRRLNERQAAELQRLGVGPARGAVRDALTLFDENAAWVQLPAALAEAWRQQDWQRLFVQLRADWANARVTLFGHALLDKLCAPRKPITAHGWALPPGLPAGAADDWLVQHLDELLPRRHPLVVLGVPGWWPANADPGYYADPAVFRPPAEGRGALADRLTPPRRAAMRRPPTGTGTRGRGRLLS